MGRLRAAGRGTGGWPTCAHEAAAGPSGRPTRNNPRSGRWRHGATSRDISPMRGNRVRLTVADGDEKEPVQ